MLVTLKCEKLKQTPRKRKPKRPPAFEKSTSGKFKKPACFLKKQAGFWVKGGVLFTKRPPPFYWKAEST